jgi:hypothetical protein
VKSSEIHGLCRESFIEGIYGGFEVTMSLNVVKMRITSTFAHKIVFGWSLRIIFSNFFKTYVTAIMHAKSCFCADFEDNHRLVHLNG